MFYLWPLNRLWILHILQSVATFEAIDAAALVKFVATLKIAVHIVFFNKIQILIDFCKWIIS